ncbi:hypothetical protein BDV38DRAFT_274047 [Aspergillus pseudotamarii]|uniref:Uncharacterized protein n=2 Tax=Aspergillus subgen. Circumdati TaxID=2720871 RepID=A0A5N6SIZ0_ASPPS|nr:uncharacterized protein BDV38DRAFT_274047 [Aspergillus pseudotamarii]XP_031934137.1 uncharacterized protein BDV37DRAFT_289954 [Aspergillus pseudonomiae]KAE8133859.1 hypothetical protein BDV38DRAFT_274047 [Aspergillus pseudotamarii]KAE8396818.1 hypothetical protein BDV37DRAFT_289954 [Aspergillus pseudonomiae]
MHQFPRRSLDPITEEITPVDHEILRHGGTSSSIERLPSRLQRSKRASTDIRQQLEDLVYDASYLRAELQWQKESKQALLQFHEDMFRIFHTIEDMLVQVAARLRDSEQRYFEVLGFEAHGGNDGGMI